MTNLIIKDLVTKRRKPVRWPSGANITWASLLEKVISEVLMIETGSGNEYDKIIDR